MKTAASDERALLVVMRAADMTKVHPRTDWTHQCERCHEPVGIYPSGQRMVRELPDIEIVCDVCAGDPREVMLSGTPLPGVRQEMRESIDFDFTKKKSS